MSLSSLIVQREIATIRQVEEALARQVVYGGDLVTNLLEVARVDEATVTELLAESLGLPPAPAGELPLPSDRARAMVPPEMAAERALVPLSVESERLVLAVAERLPPDVEEQLEFALGLPIDQRASPMVRIRQALTAAFGFPLERRFGRLIARLSGAPSSVGGSMPPLLSRPPEVVEPPKMRSAPPSKHSPSRGVPATSLPSHRITSAGFPAVSAQISPDTPAPPVTVPPAAKSTTPAPPSVDGPRTPVVTGPSRPPSVSPSGRPALIQRAVVHTSRPPRRRRGPVTFDDAKREVEEAADRDALLDLFFDFSRQFFDYSVIFIVHGDIAEGRDAWGAGASRERVVGIGVPLDMPSLLSTAKERRAPLTAPPSTDGLDPVLIADLQRSTRAAVLVVPIVVRTRAVALFLGDCGELGVDAATAGEVASFAVTVGHAFEKIIVRRKLQGFIAGSSATSAGRIDPTLVGSKAPPAIARRLTPSPNAIPRYTPPPRFDASPLAHSTPPPASLPPEPGLELADDLGLAPAPPPARSPVPPSAEAIPPAPISNPIVSPPISRARVSEGLSPRPAPPPPPANVTVVRKHSGRPIPREEPDSTRRERSSPVPPSPTPTTESAHADDTDRAPEVAENAMDDETARALLDEIERQPVSDQPPPAGYDSQAIAVPPHRPPTSRAAIDDELPSVMFDTASELGVLVDRVLAAVGDEDAEAELLRQGQAAMPAIMARFPGPVSVDRGRFNDAPARVSECGPILRLIAGQRKVALPFVVERLADADPESRYWATFLLTELPYAEAAAPVVPLLFDEEARTRRAARLALSAIAKAGAQPVVDEVAKIALDAADVRRGGAIAVLGELREPLAIPVLVPILEERDDTHHDVTQRALVTIARQDFGDDARKWGSWWTANATRHRIEWLIDALNHDVSDIRRAAGEELKALTKEYFGFSDDLPPRERERAQQRYRDWWVTEGRGRFRRR